MQKKITKKKYKVFLVLISIYSAFMISSYCVIYLTAKSIEGTGEIQYLYSRTWFTPTINKPRPNDILCSDSIFSIRPDKILTQNLLNGSGLWTWKESGSSTPIHFGFYRDGRAYYWSFRNMKLIEADQSGDKYAFSRIKYKCN